jgi:hypothetical protein
MAVIRALAVVGVALSCTVALAAPTGFTEDYDGALAAAQAQGKLVFVFFAMDG